MPSFFRIFDQYLLILGNVQYLGFPTINPSFIPDDYLDKKQFVVFRTCHSIGDWALISAMPRLLKQKYPDCKVFLPSPKILSDFFNSNAWSQWDNPFENVKLVFENNPYVDGYVDVLKGDAYHDHYRIFDFENSEIPLIVQMLKFWQFKDEEIKDYLPELYFSKEEIKLGNSIIKKYISNKKFGTLLLTNTLQDYYSDETNNKIFEEIEQYKNLTFFYYGSKSIKETIFKNINVIDFKELNLPIRIQLYIKTKALVNIGYQSGINDAVCRYSKVICTPSTGNLGSNFLDSIKYLR